MKDDFTQVCSGMIGLAALLLVICLGEAGCVTNPYTDRWQLMMVSSGQEMQLGEKAYQQVLQDPEVKISTDPREVEPVRRVADRVIEAAKKSKYADLANQFQWEVSVIKDDQTLNAFALPGGKIAVYTGIFTVSKNEAGLAAVMGHEVVHALARHGGERMSQNVVAQGALTVANVGLAVFGVDPILGTGAMAALGAGTKLGVLLPFSRKHESEADYIGMLLAAQAGYDPREAVRVWERMAQLSGEAPSEYLSTHPAHETRIKQLQEWLPEALPLCSAQGCRAGAELPPIVHR
ncbi:MAG: M48 family metallopeptidase [Nitrospiraceae bacterium]